MNAGELARVAGEWALWNSAGAAILVLLVLLAQRVLGSRVSARWRHNLWLLVVVRLMLPALPAVRVHLPEWAKAAQTEKHTSTASIAVSEMGHASVAPPPVLERPLSSETSEIETTTAQAAPAEIHPAPVEVLTEPATATPATIEPSRVSNVEPAPVPRDVNPAPHSAPLQINWMRLTEAVWLAGVVVLLIRLTWTSVQLWRVTRSLNPVSDPDVTHLVAECGRLLRIKRLPTILASKSNCSPALIGIFRPKLLLPPCVLGDFGPAGLRLIVLHELAHLKRRDVAVNYLLSILQAIHWFNPLVWFAFARLRAERELACDEAVLRAPGAPAGREYGQTILKLIESLSRGGGVPAGALGVVQHKVLMHRRMTMIAKFDPTRRDRSVAGALLSLIVGGAMVASAVRAQDAKPSPNPLAQPAPSAQSVDGARRAVDAAAAPKTDPLAQDPSLTPLPASATAAPAQITTPVTASATAPQTVRVRNGGSQVTLPPPLASGAPSHAIRTVDDPSAAQANAKTTEKLRKPVTPTFQNIPLRDCLSYLADNGALDIVTDNRTLNPAQSMDAPITMRIHEPRPLDQVLQLTLRMAGPELDYALVNGVVFISTRSELSHHIVTRAYDPGDADRPALERSIANATGGGAEIVMVNDKLLVTASEPDQREIAKLLAVLPGRGSQQRQGAQIGRQGATDTTFTLYALRYASASDLVDLLRIAGDGRITVTADERTNALLIRGSTGDIKAAVDLAAKLDQAKNNEHTAGMDKAESTIANMRALVEQFTEANRHFGSQSKQAQQIAKQIESCGTELDRMASSLAKLGKEADAAKIRDEMQKIKTMLEPFSSDPEFLKPATTKR